MAPSTTTISRRLPQSNVARHTAINHAYTRLADLANPFGNFISTPVYTRLAAIRTSYNAGMDALGPKEDTLHDNTAAQNITIAASKDKSILFVRGINLGVDIGVFTASNRSFYGLPVETGKLPTLRKIIEIKEFAKKLVLGESQRVAGGGTAATYPPITMVQTPLTALQTLWNAEGNLKAELDIAQEAVNDLNQEADEVIKKVWGEVEVFFNREEKESQRASCRDYGVVYESRGPKTPITFTVTGPDIDSILLTRITMIQTGHAEIPDVHGKSVFETRVVGPVQFEVKCAGFVEQTLNVTIESEAPQSIAVALIPR